MPGGDSDAGLEPHVPAHAVSLSVLSSRGMWSPGGLGWQQGLEERGCPLASAPEGITVPKENRRVRAGELRGKRLLWGAAPGKVCRDSSLSPNWGGAGWEITPWRLFSPGILPHPSSTGCGAAWGGKEWVRESLSPQGLQEQ